YEGYSMREITFPVRVMRMLGAKNLVVSNIAGGLNPEFQAGDIVLIVDQINLMGDNPLIGHNDERLGPRFPDMMEPYDRRLISLAEKHARRMDYHLARGVYAAMSGPSFETRAEYRMLRILGADMIGMSSVPEVIVAVHGGMRVLGLSLISDDCFPECLEPLDIDLLLERARIGSEIIGEIVKGVLTDGEFLND
ncbi:MAG TPA: purine-nucleoside phosphorylase, partial [Bacteroidetes bacterium]|nr:purine-nucleoside phosphorylase [Bacteroidota bacterium]